MHPHGPFAHPVIKIFCLHSLVGSGGRPNFKHSLFHYTRYQFFIWGYPKSAYEICLPHRFYLTFQIKFDTSNFNRCEFREMLLSESTFQVTRNPASPALPYLFRHIVVTREFDVCRYGNFIKRLIFM